MLDISLAKSYLKGVKIPFNNHDKIECYGDLSTLEGTIDQYGGLGTKIHFRIMQRDNGVFVDWHYPMGKSRIDRVS